MGAFELWQQQQQQPKDLLATPTEVKAGIVGYNSTQQHKEYLPPTSPAGFGTGYSEYGFAQQQNVQYTTNPTGSTDPAWSPKVNSSALT